MVFPSNMRHLPLAAAAMAFGVQASALAQEAVAPAQPPTQEAITEELIRRLQKHNALSKEDAEDLLRMLQTRQAPATPPAVAAPAAQPGDVRVIHLPEGQRQRIRDEVKQEVLAEVKSRDWMQRNELPGWLDRISLGGDLRLRYEWDYFDSSNSPFFVNYNAINTGNAYDSNANNNVTLPPLLNTTEQRQQMRVRARLDLDAAVADDLSAGFRFTSGNNTNPVSTNQTLGTDFNKLSFVIDRAYLEYRPGENLSIWGARMPNPWFSPTDLAWDDDLNFDGIAAQLRGTRGRFGFAPFMTVGAFAVQNTAFDFPSTSASKVDSHDKWLFGTQIGFESGGQSWSLKEALTYYHYRNIEGRHSSYYLDEDSNLVSSCLAITASDSCDSDHTRPAFLQKGNTLFALRDPLPDPDDPDGGPAYQYFGLASPFRILALSMEFDRRLQDGIHVVFSGDALMNLAYDEDEVLAKGPVNNFAASIDTDGDGIAETAGPYDGGRYGGQVQVLAGYPQIKARGEWNVTAGYRALESDATVDAFTDSDFHLGGTNAKGFYLRGGIGFTRNAWMAARWFSATEVSGPPLAIDVLQFDVNAEF